MASAVTCCKAFRTTQNVHRRQVAVRSAAPQVSRREALQAATATVLLTSSVGAPALAAEKKPAGPIVSALCDEACVSALPERVTLPSGLAYQDIVVGTGATPVKGFQVTVNYVAMNAEGRSFDSSIEKGMPYDIRFGAGSVIPGLDEGLKTMKSGGIRRLYIPGDLAFPKGLPAAAGRPRIPPASPVVFDVQLLYIPGFEDEE